MTCGLADDAFSSRLSEPNGASLSALRPSSRVPWRARRAAHAKAFACALHAFLSEKNRALSSEPYHEHTRSGAQRESCNQPRRFYKAMIPRNVRRAMFNNHARASARASGETFAACASRIRAPHYQWSPRRRMRCKSIPASCTRVRRHAHRCNAHRADARIRGARKRRLADSASTCPKLS